MRKAIICNLCRGVGQTKATATTIEVVDGKNKTINQGSGCPKCLGTGRLNELPPLRLAPEPEKKMTLGDLSMMLNKQFDERFEDL